MGSPRRRGRFSVSVVALATALFFIPGVPAALGATTHEVSCPTDSLQDAIDAAAPGDTILVEGTCEENIVIDKDLVVNGLDGHAAGATFDGGGDGSVVRILPGVSAQVLGATITNGAAEAGAGIYNEGDLALIDSWVRYNGVDSSNVVSHRGAGVFNAAGATLDIVDTGIDWNVAWWAAGGLYNRGAATIDGSSFIFNEATASAGEVHPIAGAIVNTGQLSIAWTIVRHNKGANVGGLDNRAGGTLDVADSYFILHGEPCGLAGFVAGAVRNSGTATFTNTLFEDNHSSETGGGISNFGELSIVGSTFNSNSTCDAGGAGGGGGLFNAGTAVVESTVFDGNSAPDDSGGGILNKGEMTVADSHFEGNYAERYGGAVSNGSHQFSDASLVISDSTITSSESAYSSAFTSLGAVHATGLAITGNLNTAVTLSGVATLADSRIIGTVRTDPAQLGAGVHVIDGQIVMSNVEITDNAGRGIFAGGNWEFSGSPEIEIQGAEISRNGGGIELEDAILTLRNSALSNVGVDRGGALYAHSSSYAVLKSVEFTENEARSGGAIFLGEPGWIDAEDVILSTNRADNGGALFIDGGLVEFHGSRFDHNSAQQSGGAVSIENGGLLELHGSTANDNSAGINGGAIHVHNSSLQANGSIINANNAANGGAIASVADSRSVLSLTSASFNSATDYGGGVFNVASVLEIWNSAVTQNQAGRDGGGVESRFGSHGSATVFGINSTIASNHADRGSGVANRNGTLTMDHVTLTDNVRGPALFEETWARKAIVTNSIVAGNRVSDCESTAMTSGGGNLLGSSCDVAEAQATDALGVADPQLEFDGIGAIVNSATPTPGSPAIDRIPVADCTRAQDQTWTTPRPLGAGCDSGSIEAEVDVVDTTPPAIDADFVHGHQFPSGLVLLTGTATDDVGVRWVGIAVQQLDTKLWLQDDGVTWGDFNRFEATLSDPGQVVTDWVFGLSLPDDRYVLSALAKDAAGNEGRIVPWRLFVVGGADTTPPVVDADFGHNTELPVGSALTGTATDDVGVTWVGIAVQRLDTKQWLQDDEVSWGNFNRIEATLSDPGTVATDWSLVVDLPVGHYVLSARAKDAAGNSGYIVPWRGFYII